MKQINISNNFSLKALKKSSDFIFDYIDLLYCKCYKINLNHSESNLNFSLWVKKRFCLKHMIINALNMLHQFH